MRGAVPPAERHKDPHLSTSPFGMRSVPPSEFATIDPRDSMRGPAFQTLPQTPPDTGADHSWIVGPSPVMGRNLVMTVTRLLDMPIETSLFGGQKAYRVRVFDEKNRELVTSGEIRGVLQPESSPDPSMETLALGEKEGIIRLRTESPLLFIQVEHSAGGMGALSKSVIGRCQIHRLDPRSSQVWPYLLSDEYGVPVNCGIELKAQEETGIPPMSTPSQSATQASGSGRKSSGPRPADMQDLNHGVSAMMEFEKVADMPRPSNENMRQLLLSVQSTERDRELRRAGPFTVKHQDAKLCRADCARTRVFVQAPLHFGGDADEGAMYVKVEVCHASVAQASLTELVGVTDPIKVTWRPIKSKYYEIRQKGTRNVLGGIYLTHRLLSEAEVAKQHQGQGVEMGMPGMKAMPQLGPPIEPLHRVSGRTGNFPPGSPEEALEQAAINGEAQNRALLQRCKIADPSCHERDPHVRHVNGYREWDSLDSLFTTMGPNPLAQSEEVGPSVTRSYQQTTSIMKEIAPTLGLPRSAAEEHLNLELIKMMYKGDPRQVHTALRPAICKDPDEIAATKDMRWCPDPPVYAPIRNMREEDKETLRLACFDPSQSAKLFFADANPNYRMNEDIWGVLADYKTAQSAYIPKPDTHHRRVKDDCLMA